MAVSLGMQVLGTQSGTDDDSECIFCFCLQSPFTVFPSLGRGTVQSFLAIMRGRPVIEVRTHSIECSAHQVLAKDCFLIVETEASSFLR
jgi:hypothetical protein